MDRDDDRLAAIEARLAALEAAHGSATADFAGGVLWALEGLKARLPGGAGAVVYAGYLPVGSDEHYQWQHGITTDDLLAGDWVQYAPALAALGQPVRLRLLREILGGRRSAADLARIEDLGTTGQLYHHLRQLVGAGWLRATSRGHYAVPADRVIPLLAVLTAVHR